MSITINRAQAEQLLEMFGGEDGEVSLEMVAMRDERALTPGLYAWFTEYPENGSTRLEGEWTPAVAAPGERAAEAIAEIRIDGVDLPDGAKR